MKLVIACAGLLALTFTACASYAAPVDVCKGPIEYVEIATYDGKYPTDPITPDAGTDGYAIWSPALNLKQSNSNVLCYANGSAEPTVENLPVNVSSCKMVPSNIAGKKTMLCE
ncbi:MAG: hypothetical protein DI585_01725 [Pseudomonas fluorescens]|nr:MAG: hypothetical protein DI585_01725 [Pseudomonas fluorescens]